MRPPSSPFAATVLSNLHALFFRPSSVSSSSSPFFSLSSWCDQGHISLFQGSIRRNRGTRGTRLEPDREEGKGKNCHASKSSPLLTSCMILLSCVKFAKVLFPSFLSSMRVWVTRESESGPFVFIIKTTPHSVCALSLMVSSSFSLCCALACLPPENRKKTTGHNATVSSDEACV